MSETLKGMMVSAEQLLKIFCPLYHNTKQSPIVLYEVEFHHFMLGTYFKIVIVFEKENLWVRCYD